MVKTTSKHLSRKAGEAAAAHEEDAVAEPAETGPRNYRELDLPGLRSLRLGELQKVAADAKLTINDLHRNELLRALEIKLELAG